MHSLYSSTAVLMPLLLTRLLVAQSPIGNEQGFPPEPPALEQETDQPPSFQSELARERPPLAGNEHGYPPEPYSLVVPDDQPILVEEYLVIPSFGQYGRAAFGRDVLEWNLAGGTFQSPKAGDAIGLPGGEQKTWQSEKVDQEGWLNRSALRGGYAYAEVESSQDRIALLSACGHSAVYVNGVPRTGDPYNMGTVQLPIELKEGTNWLLFHIGTGRLRAKLIPSKRSLMLDMTNATLPDLIAGETETKWAAMVIINAANEARSNLSLVCKRPDGEAITTRVPTIPPLSVFKAPFQLDGHVQEDQKEVEFQLHLVAEPGEQGEAIPNPMAALSFSRTVVQKTEMHQRTFISEIDGSVQYYAVQPGNPSRDGSPGIILSLHGAGVEATQQAAYYTAKDWAHVIAPTNRGKYGFDWEDWGRLDALEVLADAQKRYQTDPKHVVLTGHSMGGHGTWHLGATCPGQFAAIGPSAGWVSFWSYGGMQKFQDPTPMEKMLLRASVPSDTAVLVTNLGATGISILHGQADSNVPVAQSRFMREHLGKFHTDFVYYEKHGAGHWWGNLCCDWPPMMNFFQFHRLPDSNQVRQINFITANPGIASQMGWLTIQQQRKPLLPSQAIITCDPDKRVFSGKTKNISCLTLDVQHLKPGGRISIELDGCQVTSIRWPGKTKQLLCRRHQDQWQVTDGILPQREKGPHRYGMFKDAFRHRAILVYGTRGNDSENAWALAKARYDAESFWYRGNGALEVVADTAFKPDVFQDRNVILYGNADTNAAWPILLSTSPVQVRRGAISIGTRRELGDNLACLFIVPRPNSAMASIGVISGTGLAGLRATNRLRYFVSGVAYPDLAIFGHDVLTDGISAVRTLGFFGADWSIENGEFEWRDMAL